jgi:hypothetical protein
LNHLTIGLLGSLASLLIKGFVHDMVTFAEICIVVWMRPKFTDFSGYVTTAVTCSVKIRFTSGFIMTISSV